MRNCFLILFVTFLLVGCSSDRHLNGDPMEYVPMDAGVVLELENPDLFFSNLRNNELIKASQTHPLYQRLQEQFSFLDILTHSKPAALAFAKMDNGISFSFITHASSQLDSLDSIQNRQVETLKFPDYEIMKYTLDEQVSFVGSIDSLLIVSDSEALLRQSLEGQNLFPADSDLIRARTASSSKSPSLFINHLKGMEVLQLLLPNADLESLEEFSNWTGLDVEITHAGIRLNGVSTATQGKPKLLNVFKDVPPAPIEIPGITPSNSKGFKAIGYRDFQKLQQNLVQFRTGEDKGTGTVEEAENKETVKPAPVEPADLPSSPEDSTLSNNPTAQELQRRQVYDSKEEELLSSSVEMGLIYLNDSKLFAVRPQEILGSLHNFSTATQTDVFRGVQLYAYSADKNFNELLAPLLNPGTLKHYAALDPFVVFSENRSNLEELIIAYQNENVLSQSDSYSALGNSLSSASSLLHVRLSKSLQQGLSQWVASENSSATSNLELDQYPLSSLQLIYQNNYAHVHGVLQKTNGASHSTQGTRQTAAVELDAPVATRPVFFSNHRSKGKDIAVQDEDNTLYLLSEAGSIYWKKQLETRILGDIQEVDLYKNGRIQLAFATQNKLHIIDRNGNPVKPFPLSFNDEITQPLGLFDYSSTRDYRFVIVQDKEVLMYDRRGQSVRGFGFNKAASELVQPLKHIRIGSRDYILAVEESGKLNILNRRGQTRVTVKEQFDLSQNKWFEYKNQFISTSQEGELLKIDQNGKLSRENLGLDDGHHIVATPNTLVTLSENQLTIKGKTLNLDFGLYTAPQIFYINNKIYISITDLQAQRVFLFDSNAELLPNFPVFGTSGIDLGNADSDANLELTVQGDTNTVLVYEL